MAVCRPLRWVQAPAERHRSEEGRVGKEGRSRWAPYHLKKKKARRVETDGRLHLRADAGSPHAAKPCAEQEQDQDQPAAFFFSSRRRHTRCLSDWSSDVCSSD